MVSIIVKDWDTGKLYGHLKTRKLDSIMRFDLLPVLNEAKDIFPLDDVRLIVDPGINRCQSQARVLTNKPSDADLSKFEPRCMNIEKENGDVEETSIKLHVIAYPVGYILNVGAPVTNIFGVSNPGYLKNITSKRVTSSSINSCHIFPTITRMLAYVRKHRNTLEYLHKKSDWRYSYEYTCDEYKEEIQKKGVPKSEQAAEKSLLEILEEINAVVEEEDKQYIPDNPTPDDIQSEAIYRMERLNLMSSIRNQFKQSGKIFMSEFGGVLYDLNKDAESVVSQAKECGYIPYHVIVSHTKIGDMYSVLYVSADVNEWEYERPKHGQTLAYVYNAEGASFSEIGTIEVRPANGGLTRIA